MSRALSQVEWVLRATEIHGDKYDYSRSVYKGSNDRISIFCRLCGTEFEMPAAQHSSPSTRKGCPECGKKKLNSRKRASLESFIEKGHRAHKNKYKYEKVVYVNNATEVIITCPLHGDFPQKPRDHTRQDRPRGCPYCAPISGGKKRTKTQEQFILELRERFGERFGLDRANYQNSETEVELLCRDCNQYFPVQPKRLLTDKVSCHKCDSHSKRNQTGTYKRISYTQLDAFICAAQKRFGIDRYNYSKSNIDPDTLSVTVLCRKHGPFTLKTASFLRSNCPCPECNSELNRQKRREKFIEKGKALFGNKFDYNLVNYIDSDTKVEIICDVHGRFEITPSNHLRSKTGCTSCGLEVAVESRRSNNEEFLVKAQAIYGFRYQYPDLNYNSKHTEIQIYCKEHDFLFKVAAHHHLAGQGCPQCSFEARTYSLEQIISMAREHHGNRYDYNETKLIRVKEPFMVSCLEHGPFQCIPYDHARGRGHCPKCFNLKGFNSSKAGVLYWLRAINSPLDLVKIGISNSPERRIEQLRNDTPFEFEPVAILEFDKGRDALDLETDLHQLLRDYNAELEGFDGCTEWFHVSDLVWVTLNQAIKGRLIEYMAELKASEVWLQGS